MGWFTAVVDEERASLARRASAVAADTSPMLVGPRGLLIL